MRVDDNKYQLNLIWLSLVDDYVDYRITRCVILKRSYLDYNNDGDDSDSTNKSLSGGEIAGITIGCLIAVGVVVALIVWFVIRRNKKNDSSKDTMPSYTTPPL